MTFVRLADLVNRSTRQSGILGESVREPIRCQSQERQCDMRKDWYVLINVEDRQTPGTKAEYLSLIRVCQHNEFYQRHKAGYRWMLEIHAVAMGFI